MRILLCMATLIAIAISGAAATCQLDEPPLRLGAWRYQQRGDRCEGRLLAQVSGGALDVAGLSYGPGEIAARNLLLSWSSPPDSGAVVHLLALPLSSFHYYQMDANFASSTLSWTWPGDVRGQLGYAPGELGLVAFTSVQVLGRTERVYLPVRMTNAPRDNTVHLMLKSDAELREVFVAITRLDGAAGTTLRRKTPLRAGPYPLREGIHVSLAELKAAGFYRIDLLASEVSAGDRPAQYIWIYLGNSGS